MPEINFHLSRDDIDRLFAVKQMQGHNDLTGNEFAELLLTRELQRLFPAMPEFDEHGRVANPERYKGG